jgi:hypothetical protein
VTRVGPKEKESKNLFDCEADSGENKKDIGKSGEKRPDVNDIVKNEMIDINHYRFKGLTQNAIWSTCPVLPKYHVTFGEPIERQEVSTEFEVDKHFDPRKESAIRLHGRIDFYTEH